MLDNVFPDDWQEMKPYSELMPKGICHNIMSLPHASSYKKWIHPNVVLPFVQILLIEITNCILVSDICIEKANKKLLFLT